MFTISHKLSTKHSEQVRESHLLTFAQEC